MKNIVRISLLTVALVSLGACMSGGSNSNSDTFTITHTTKGTLYWE